MSNQNMPAFPSDHTIVSHVDEQGEAYRKPAIGLTKREYFAAMAMQGLCANSIPGSHHGFLRTAEEAVRYADALLADLAK